MTASGPTALAAGERLGPYEIVAPLGTGGMGEVYRARDERLGREVAVKVLSADSSTDPDRLRRFEQEARAAGALSHPNLLAVFDAGRHDGSPYLVFELLEGRTLRQVIAQAALPARKALDYARQIAEGLAAAHEKGIVHRDLKPENVFLTRDDRIKILDFGLAKLRPALDEGAPRDALSTATAAGVVLGTAGYMSPEQVRGEPADHRSDIFSLGTVLYEMLWGRRPFAGDTAAEVMAAILKEHPPELNKPEAGGGIEPVVARCLAKRPEDRFQSARDVAFALQMAASGTSVAFAAPRSRHRALLGAAAVLVVVGLAVFAVRLASGSAEPRLTGYTQLTDDLVRKFGPVTDGARVYFTRASRTGDTVAQIAARGGEVAQIATSLIGPRLLDVSPDGAELLVAGSREPPAPDSLPEVWKVPVVGGAPRRLGDVRAVDAAWSPDGQRIVYSTGDDVRITGSDGSGSRLVWTAHGIARWPAWSPDGRKLRLTVFTEGESMALWEVGADGQDPRRLLPAFPLAARYGRWTPDGKYFLFTAWGGFGKNEDVWAVREAPSWLGWKAPEPVRLTQGPFNFSSHVVSRDGRKVFAIGERQRGELVRFDARAGRFVPHLYGISAHGVEFSRDGQWIAYSTFPEGALWRSRADGSERLLLSQPPPHASEPHWSPDGKRLLFTAMTSGRGHTIASYLVSVDGGQPEPVPKPDGQEWEASTWSPDGGTLGMWEPGASAIQLLDLETRRFTKVPGSEGLLVPRWSPDGAHLAALSGDLLRLVAYDFSSDRWRDVLAGKQPLDWAAWSRDGRSLFVSEGPSRLRVGITDGRREAVARLDDVQIVPDAGNRTTGHHWVGQAADDSVITLRDVSVQEIFALDWSVP